VSGFLLIHNQKMIKVVTFNVHGWTDQSGADNLKGVKETLETLEADIVCLQEVVRGHQLHRLATLLHFPHYHHVESGQFQTLAQSDAILSKFPIVATEGSEINIGRFAQQRSLVGMVVSIPLDHGSHTNNYEEDNESKEKEILKDELEQNNNMYLRIYCTHLDVGSERKRIQQLDQLLEKIQSSDYAEFGHLLVGDFNALCREDYDEDQWNKLVSIRAKNRWEPPKSLLTKRLSELGYVDSLRCAESATHETSGSFLEGFKGTTPPEVYSDVATCWAGTRIDYLWLSKDLKAKVHKYERIESHASDHYPLSITFSLV